MNHWKTYSVFISSTFSDMQSERDYLTMVVLPRLNRELRSLCVTLRIIDLRWGIDTRKETEKDVEEKVMRVCMDEIERSKPFFIGLLGQRYGWIPSSVPIDLGSDIDFAGKSITAMEIEYGFFCRSDINGCLFLERDSSCYVSMDASVKGLYDDAYSGKSRADIEKVAGKLTQLKERIKDRLHDMGRDDCYQVYSPRWENDHFSGLEDFGEKVFKILFREIKNTYGKGENDTPFADEDNRQEGFLYDNKSRICLRKSLFNGLATQIASKNSGGIILQGASGSGKSCLYTLLVDHFQRDVNTCHVLYHATSCGQESRNLQTLLKRWIFQLENIAGCEHLPLHKQEECLQYFKHLLKQVSRRGQKKLIMFIDAIDGFIPSEITRYLTFYPRAEMPGIFLFCTSTPECAGLPLQHNKNLAVYEMPPLSEAEAEDIIDTYVAYYHKEVYEDNKRCLLTVKDDRLPAYHSPLWLSLSLRLLMGINRFDFDKIVHSGTFDVDFQAYVNRLIGDFPAQDNELFLFFLKRLSEFYGDFPSKFFSFLSASYNGLPEDAIAYLMGTDWDSRTFAIIRNYMGNYMAEQGTERHWQIMHNRLRLELTAEDKENICKQIGCYYAGKLELGENVGDNIFYYFYNGNCTGSEIDYYFNSEENKDRLLAEACDLAERIDVQDFMDYLCRVYDSKDNFMKHQFRWIKVGQMKRIVEKIIKKYFHEGNYHIIPALIDKLQRYAEAQKLWGDFMAYFYITTDYWKIEAISRIENDDKTIEAYETLKGHLKIRGAISLLVIPICRRYYEWSIYKLKNQ